MDCDPDIWMNGVIICSIGITFFLSAFLLNTSIRLVSNDSSWGFNFKNDAQLSSSLPVNLLDKRVELHKRPVLYF